MKALSGMDFKDASLVQINDFLSSAPKKVILNGRDLRIPDVLGVAREKSPVKFTEDEKVLSKIKKSYQKMMEDVARGIPVYGCNTGYGGRAGVVLANGTPEERTDLAKQISEGIVHVDITVGPKFEKEIVRAAMLIRINMLMQGVSAVKIKDLEIIRKMLNKDIIPVVNQYGGVGASGDLHHNGRVVSAARQLRGVKVIDGKGKIREAKDALLEAGIPPLLLDPKAGLGLLNGDNFSTGLALLLAADTLHALLISSMIDAMMVEALRGTNRSFHPLLSSVRRHPGQKEVASLMRYLLEGSKLAYQEMKGHQPRGEGVRVQDAYSLRCLSQFQAVNFEKIKGILETISINMNSVSDNPLWVTPEFATKEEAPWQWVSGGNFIASHMVEAMDGLRKIMTQTTKLNDRHLARLINPNENNGLSANLSDKSAITQCSFKGVQVQSGMFDVYSSLLSIPVSTFFGTHEENNQDITSHALTSGILGIENLRITRYSLAQNLIAVAQAVDLRGGPSLLSPRTRPLYNFVRERADYVKKERPLNNDIEKMYEVIRSGELVEMLAKKVFKGFKDES